MIELKVTKEELEYIRRSVEYMKDFHFVNGNECAWNVQKEGDSEHKRLLEYRKYVNDLDCILTKIKEAS